MDAIRNVLTRLQRQGVALGHFNVADLLLVKAVVSAAVEVRVPVIVGASEGERVAWRRSLEDSLASQPNEVVPYKILPPVVESVKQVVGSRLKLFNGQLTPAEMHSASGR